MKLLTTLTRENVRVPQACCVHFDGFASLVSPGRGWGAIGWVTDQGDPYWATEQFKVRYCPFCGAKLRGPNGEPIDASD